MSKRIEITSEPKPLEQDAQLFVGITAHNSAHRIGRVISNLAHQRFPTPINLDILVYANACHDQTAQIARQAFKQVAEYNPRIRGEVVESDQPGEQNAINSIVRLRPAAEILTIVSDDVFPTLDTVHAISATMVENPDLPLIGVVPKILPQLHTRTFASDLARSYLHDSGTIMVVGRMFAFRPRIIGEIPDIISGDSYMTYQALKESGGFGILSESQGVVYYRAPQTVADCIRQLVLYNSGNEQFLRLYPQFNNLEFAQTLPQKGSLVSRLKRRLQTQPELGVTTKLTAMAFNIVGKKIAQHIEKTHPVQGSVRPRIRTTV